MATMEVVPLNHADYEAAAVAERQRFMPIMNMEHALDRRTVIVQAFNKLMVDGQDYGKVPGTGSKPTLLQPGAQKLDNLFGLVPRFIIDERDEDWTGERHAGEPFFRYLVKCQLFRGEFIMGEAIGECNSWESKYRYRTAERVCPTCGKGTIIHKKKGGWWCAQFKGGCNAGFPDNDPKITGQETGRKPNSEIFDQVNTLLKMAQKRAHVGATINATSASEFFTQDVEDIRREAEEIDTGGNPTGTKEARDYVRDKQVTEAQAKSTNYDMLQAFQAVKSDLKKATGSDDLYYRILGANGLEKSDQIKTREEGERVFKEMRLAFKEVMDGIERGAANATV